MASLNRFERLRRIVRLLRAITDGDSLSDACKASGVNRRTFYRQLNKFPALQDRYAQACQHRATTVAENALEMAKAAPDMLEETKADGTVIRRIDPAYPGLLRTRFETFRWFAATTHPRKYGRALEVSGDVNVKHEDMTELEVARRLAFVLSQGVAQVPTQDRPPALEYKPAEVVEKIPQREVPNFLMIPNEEHRLREIEDKALAMSNERSSEYQTGRPLLTARGGR